MTNRPTKTASSTPPPGRKSTTRPNTDGAVLPVTNPLDLWYLCQKAGYAEKYPLKNSNGSPMYQRTVTQWVRKDGEFFGWHFPYYGEVGFDMTRSPPRAIMSRKDGNRPSRMPLSQYESLIDRYSVLQSTKVGVIDALLTKQYLEDNLSPADFERANQIVQVARTDIFGKTTGSRRIQVPGLLRIPDVIRVKDRLAKGAERYAPGNLEFVIEMKFSGDSLSAEQDRDYRKIAGGDSGKFRLMNTGTCKIERQRRRGWLEEARRTEPVFKDVRVSGPVPTARAMALQDSVGEISLLIGDIEEEHQKVRRILQPASIPANVPQMHAVDPAADRRTEEQHQHTRTSLELALAAPMAAAAVGTAIVGGSTLLTGGVTLGEGATVVATQSGGKLIQFPVGRIVAGTAANAAIFEAAAAPTQSGAGALTTSSEVFDIYAPMNLVYIDE
jgi:hypothetical protein